MHEVLQRGLVATRRRLHRGRGQHLHQVVHNHVAQRSHGVVEVAAVLYPEALRHRDLHRRDVLPVPQRLEDRVGEAQVEDLDEPHLPEEVVDPVELVLVDVPVHLVVQLTGRLEVVPERLLNDHAGVLGEAGVA